MKTDTTDRIIQYIAKNKQVSPIQLVEHFELSPQAIHKQLKKIIEQGKLEKIGKPPKVFYILKKNHSTLKNVTYTLLKNTDKEKIQTSFLQITPEGKITEGVEAFAYWCQRHNLPIQKTAEEYIKTLKKYDQHKDVTGFINGTKKIKNSFDNIYLDKVYYLDFYSIERFGKTKLGQMLLYAKQNQNQKLIKKLTQSIKPRVQKIIEKFNIDGVGFIPPTLKREVQLMHVMAKNLGIRKEIISILKVTSDIAVPQKSLSKIQDRIENANKTIYVTDKRVFRNILLIDDAVGSGATLNETAKKIRNQNICKGKIIGLALTGSFKGFDVISEV